MPEIYRLEYNGKGVYWGADDAYYRFLDSHQHDPENHPRPDADGLRKALTDGMLFGFASLDQMKSWFDGAERLYLSTFGVVCCKYFARGPILTGRCQVAFYRACADLIWIKPLNHF